jgi:leader peptidase (prepilin peptidase)/N-methyltransferase
VFAVLAVGPSPTTIPLLYLAAITPPLWLADLTERRLPNRLVLPGYPVVLIAAAIDWLVSHDPPVVALVSGVAYLGFLVLLGLGGGMGMGDIKLAGVLGVAAGLVGVVCAVASPVTAFLGGGVAGMLVLRRGSRASIPFGPFMLAGFWVAIALAGLGW